MSSGSNNCLVSDDRSGLPDLVQGQMDNEAFELGESFSETGGKFEDGHIYSTIKPGDVAPRNGSGYTASILSSNPSQDEPNIEDEPWNNTLNRTYSDSDSTPYFTTAFYSPPQVSSEARCWFGRSRLKIAALVVIIILLVSALAITAGLLVHQRLTNRGPLTSLSPFNTTKQSHGEGETLEPSSTITSSTQPTTSVEISRNETNSTLPEVTPDPNTNSVKPPVQTTSTQGVDSTVSPTIPTTPTTTTPLTTTTPPTTPTPTTQPTEPTNTTVCPGSRKCHSCTSNSDNCPANGEMTEKDHGQLMDCPCSKTCFSEIRHDGVVHRGCSLQFPRWDEMSQDDLSCRSIGTSFLCFCFNDRCNTHDMTPFTDL